MTINSINGTNTQAGQMGLNQMTDSYTKSLQKQIANAQKQLQELSSNEDMEIEEKMKKRQELQQQISELNMQLRQHQMELQREKQQEKRASMDDMTGMENNGRAKEERNGAGLSQTSMTAIVSADNSIKQAKVQGSVAAKMEGVSGVLESEIKMDQTRGINTQKKEEDLADVKLKAQSAASSQISTLADAGKTMKEAAEADSKEEKTKDRGEKTTSAEEQDSEISDSKSIEEDEAKAQQRKAYTPVDIRL